MTDFLLTSTLYKISPEERSFFPITGLCGLKGEKLSCQAVIKSDENIVGLSLKISGFDGEYKIRKERCVIVENPSPQGTKNFDDYYLKNEILPDILLPVNDGEISVEQNKNTVLWVDFYLTNFGVCDAELSLTDNDGKIISKKLLKIETVYDTLCETDLFITNWFHFDCIADKHNAELWSDEYYMVLNNYLAEYVAHGYNMIYTPLFTPCLDTAVGAKRRVSQLIDVFIRDGKYCFGFEKLERFINCAIANGIKYFEFSHFYTQWGAKFCPNIVVRDNGATEEKFGWDTLSDDPEYEKFLSEFLPCLVDFIRRAGIREKCFFHISDEPDEATAEIYKKHKNFLEKYLKNYKTIDAVSSYQFADLVDVPIVAIDHAESFLENNKEIWVYYCCAQTSEYVSNRFVSMPSLRTRVLGFQLFLNHAKGFLHWGYNFYNSYLSKFKINPYVDMTGGGLFPAGDTFAVYPFENGSIDSIRNELCSEAFQDYRLCLTAAKKAGRNAVINILEKYMTGYKKYPHDEATFEIIRDEIINLL